MLNINLEIKMSLLAFAMPGVMEMCIIGFIAALLFGSQLPKVARSFGAAIPSFKKGFKEVEEEIKSVGAELEDVRQAGDKALKS